MPSQSACPICGRKYGYVRVPDLSIREHVERAERHLQRALDLAYADEPQPFWVRRALGKAQSLSINLLTGGKLR